MVATPQEFKFRSSAQHNVEAGMPVGNCPHSLLYVVMELMVKQADAIASVSFLDLQVAGLIIVFCT